MELRKRLVAETGVHIAPSVVFDHPSVGGLTKYLLEQFETAGTDADVSVLDYIERLGTSLTARNIDTQLRAEVAARLRALARICEEPGTDSMTARIESASDDDLFAFIRTEFGKD
ncbi:putative chlA1 [Rhodococcus sp. MTM3W5.2]|nr:putative chlA1 [Rhodococcus sp. MTM3W5.2]